MFAFMCVDVEPGMRAAAAVAWKPAAKITLLLYWRYLCSIEGVADACIATALGVAAARATAPAADAAGVEATRRGGGPQEAIRRSRWWSRIV